MKKLIVPIVLVFALFILNSCSTEEKNDTKISIKNLSSQDVRVSFNPEKVSGSGYDGNTFNYRPVNVKKGETVSFTLKYKRKRNYFGAYPDEVMYANPNDQLEKVIVSKMDNNEILMEIINNREDINRPFVYESGSVFTFSLEITDELLSGK